MPIVFLAFLGLSCDPGALLVEKGSGPLITIETHNLLPLASGQGHYEAWISFSNPLLPKGSSVQHEESSFVSLGRFNVDGSGNLVDLAGAHFNPHLAKDRNMSYMNDAIITIEPDGDSDDVHGPALIGGVVTGDVRIGVAELTPWYQDALGGDLRQAQGSFLIDSPTSADSADSASGVWFMQSLAPSSAGFLQLPALSPGWKYEGWVRSCCIGPPSSQGYVNYTTGLFSNAVGYDADSAGGRRGPVGNGYPYPGQDFCGVKRLALYSGTFEAMVTIEPDPDNSTAPFSQLMLFGPTPISNGVPLGQPQAMRNASDAFPFAKLRIVK